MITVNKIGGDNNISIAEFNCKSSDIENLPTENIPNGSTAFVFDIPTVYVFDVETKTWSELG